MEGTMRRLLIAACLAFVCALTLIVSAQTPGQGLIVHEWGTFLAMNGFDGVSLDGMYHEEHALPGFVHARNRNELRLPTSLMKSETPVVYFYTDGPRRVTLDVGFPNGVWTQWYPQADMVGPSLVEAGALPAVRNGRI